MMLNFYHHRSAGQQILTRITQPIPAILLKLGCSCPEALGRLWAHITRTHMLTPHG
jgi:hypothetical protein